MVPLYPVGNTKDISVFETFEGIVIGLPGLDDSVTEVAPAKLEPVKVIVLPLYALVTVPLLGDAEILLTTGETGALAVIF